jgi:hypothetical protein
MRCDTPVSYSVRFTLMLGVGCDTPVSYSTVNHCVWTDATMRPQLRVLSEGSASSEGSLWGLLGLKWGSSRRAPCTACPDAWRCPLRSPPAATVPVPSAAPLKRSCETSTRYRYPPPQYLVSVFSYLQGWAKLVSNLTFSKRKAMVFSKTNVFKA